MGLSPLVSGLRSVDTEFTASSPCRPVIFHGFEHSANHLFANSLPAPFYHLLI